MSKCRKLLKEIIENSNNGLELPADEYVFVIYAISLNGTALRSCLKTIKVIYKSVINKKFKDNNQWYHRMKGIIKDKYGEFYCNGVRLPKKFFDSKREEFSYLKNILKYYNHLQDIGVEFNEKSIDRMNWYKKIDNLMDQRCYNMINLCDFLIKDNRFIFFYDREKTFIFDIVNMEKIYTSNIDKVKDKEIFLKKTGWRSILNMYASKRANSITELPWENIELFLRYANILCINIFDDNDDTSFKSRKPIFNNLIVGTNGKNKEKCLKMTTSNNKEDKKNFISKIVFQLLSNNELLIHEYEVLVLPNNLSYLIVYNIPGAIINVTKEAFNFIINNMCKPFEYPLGEIAIRHIPLLFLQSNCIKSKIF